MTCTQVVQLNATRILSTGAAGSGLEYLGVVLFFNNRSPSTIKRTNQSATAGRDCIFVLKVSLWLYGFMGVPRSVLTGSYKDSTRVYEEYLLSAVDQSCYAKGSVPEGFWVHLCRGV